MLHFSRFKTTVIVVICALGVLLTIPNFIPQGTLPSWAPHPHVNLGLDLQGGSYLLLEVDTQAVARERLDAAVEAARTALRSAGLRYTDLGVRGDAVSVRLSDPSQVDVLRGALGDLLAATPGPDGVPRAEFSFDAAPDGLITIRLSDVALQARASRAVEQSLEIVRRRIDETGVNEPIVARQGAQRILVQLPGVADPSRIKRLLGQTAKMTFRLLADDQGVTGTAPPGTEWLVSTDSSARGQRMLVRRKVEVDGANLSDANASMDQRTGGWVVNFSFDSVGARRFADVTRNNVGRPFAIVLDDKVISAPVIREPITGGSGQISGSYTAQSATELAVLLRAGALPAPLTIVEERTIGPDLGADSIRAGILSCIVGFVLVVGFMALKYGRFGIYANVALIFNLFLTVAILSLLEATLTLPGIAGILLTLGMSVDANILINERIREETRRGRSPFAAMEAGFSRAFATITDSNLTTLIKMAILYAVGTGAIRGFAVTITFGILTSMFTATVVTRLLMVNWLRRKRPAALPVSSRFELLPHETKIPFMRGKKAGLIMSVILSLASIGLFFKPGLNYGIDFAGGIAIEIRTEQPADFATLRESVGRLNLGPVQLQQFGAPTDVLIRLERQPGGEAQQQTAVRTVQETLAREFPGTTVRRVESVGASVSGELFRDGMIALAIAAVAMLGYIWFRFEWQFGVGAVVTMLLDVTKTIGFFALTGLQFNLVAIAAILTIMGFSINDKVVVYDRVRENLRLYRKMPLGELIDRSINETMGRTIATSLAIFLSIVPLALFGGEALEEFALVLLFGVVLATSSSIFIAAPILLYLGEHRLRRGTDEAGQPAGREARAEGA
ncbi:protein translocase subunit SecD [Arenibaculum pallidiluteum]|uniref:protein translocase subunit SecD n=1 Tax=Arenibaculum pallidiluteum TaxID=2812559 RepID=UPI001A96B22A|nr:protein translocase subunit SecD [Arenibaculum pallidiluteum]